jgi:hypothetical protein
MTDVYDPRTREENFDLLKFSNMKVPARAQAAHLRILAALSTALVAVSFRFSRAQIAIDLGTFILD